MKRTAHRNGRRGEQAGLLQIVERMLRIVSKELETVRVDAIADPEEVVGDQSPGADGAVRIAHVVRAEHVVDEIVDVEQPGVAGIARAIGIQALDTVIGVVVVEA